MSEKYNVLDLFCGTGGISYGLTSADPSFQTVMGIDMNKSACQTAQANHKHANIVYGKIEDIDPTTIKEKIDVIVGGPPCQGFSSLRPSRGKNLEDPRNSLYKSFMQYVKVLQPKVFLMENVVGLVNANEGLLLEDILEGFDKVGYVVDWRIVNAANYGVPQKRERFILIGIRKDLGFTEVHFPTPTHYFSGKVIGTKLKDKHIFNTDSGHPAVTVWDAISDLPSIKSGEEATHYQSAPLNEYQSERRKYSGETVNLHQAANHSEKMLEVIKHAGSNINALPQGLVSSGYSSCYSRLGKDDVSTTITVKFTSPASSKCIHPLDDRSITPREAARLQGFDDHFIFCGSKTDIATQIGNAVPPILGSAFANVFLSILRKDI